MRTMLRSKVTLLFMTCAVILLVFPAMAFAQGAPTIQSDKADYAPGELVTLTGSGWVPGESVHIVVNDTNGATWQRTADVIADPSGNITDSFNLPNTFVSDYDVTATGAQSGTATTTFTDALQTATTVASSPTSSTDHQSVTFTGTVSCNPANNGCTFSTTNSMNFVDGANANCNGGTTLGTVSGANFTGSGSSRTATFTTNSLSIATHSIRACFNGGGPGTAAGNSVSAALSHVVTADITSPTDGDTTTNSTINVSGTASDAAGIQDVKVNGNVATFTYNSGSTTSGTWTANNVSLVCGSNTITAVATDNSAAHKTASTSITVTRAGGTCDTTAPTSTHSLSSAANANGWHNQNVTVTLNATDNTGGSGVKEIRYSINGGPNAVYDSANKPVISTEGTTTFNYFAVDNANNTENPVNSFQIKLDKTAPTSVSGSPNRVADHNGWYNHAVGFTFTGTDTLSGIDSCSTPTYSGPDGTGKTVSGSCTDKAGNPSASVASSAIDYDATAPTSVATALNRVADHNGWYNHSVSWTTTGTDETSGIDSCDSGTYNGPDGTGKTVSGKCTDNAGNASAEAASAAFKYDASAPSVTAQADRGPDHNGWYNHALTVSFSGTDETSGIANCDANVNYNGPDTDSASRSGSCADEAGNSASDTFNFKYDATVPTISGSKSPGPNTFGWNNGSVTVSYSCNDATSGVASCGPNATLSSEGANQSSTGNATDEAGNTASTTVSGINIDKSAPTGIAFVGGGLTDGQSYDFGTVPNGPTGCTADGSISGLQPDPDGCKVTGYDTTVGPHTVTATAKDKAGNTATKTLSYTVKAATAKGFYQPVDMGGVLNTVKSGSTVPVKFELFGGASNTEQKTVSAVGSMTASKVNCAAFNGDPVDAIEYLAPTSENTGLRFDTTGDQFIYNWKTPAKAANTCYNLTMTAADNTTKLVAYFKLT